MHYRKIDREIGSAVCKGYPLYQRRIGIDHRGSNIRAALVEGFFESLEGVVRSGLLKKYFRGSAPDHYQAIGAGAFLEVLDVGAKLLGQIHLRLAFFHVMAVELLHVMPVENCLARLHRLQEWLDLIEQILFKDAGLAGGGVHVVLEDVPSGEDQIAQV